MASATPVPTALARVTFPVRPEQPRHPEQAVGAERLGVQEVVVQPAVDHVHLLRPGRRLQVHHVVVDEQVLAEDQFDPMCRARKLCSK